MKKMQINTPDWLHEVLKTAQMQHYEAEYAARGLPFDPDDPAKYRHRASGHGRIMLSLPDTLLRLLDELRPEIEALIEKPKKSKDDAQI